MATLNALKQALRQKAATTALISTQPSSESQYDAGFNILSQGSGKQIYEDFIVPQLSLLLASLLQSRVCISVLEIGPGPESVVGRLPAHQRQRIRKYAAFEPNGVFATRLQRSLASENDPQLPCLESPPHVSQTRFDLNSNTGLGGSIDNSGGVEKYDLVLFCHSMYGMEPKRGFVEHALQMLVGKPGDSMVVVFHRDGTLQLDGLVCHRTASHPTGTICVADDDDTLDVFARFIAGPVSQDLAADKTVAAEWRKTCRTLGRYEDQYPSRLFFSSPELMVAFTQHATALPELLAKVPVLDGHSRVKNREARNHLSASIIRPESIQQVRQCVDWALKHGAGLTIIGGSHSGQCVWPNVVAVDMSAFDQVDVLTSAEGSLVVVGGGCNSGDIVRKTMAAGLTVPLGSRPGVGAGLWLQGGIGHLARQRGLACDAIVGAVVVSVASGEVVIVGHVPTHHRPAGALESEAGGDLLWALRGAGNNFGIVISVTLKDCAAPRYTVRNWIIPLSDNDEGRLKLNEFDKLIARQLPTHCSADAYLYCEEEKLYLGVMMFESTTGTTVEQQSRVDTILGPVFKIQTVDSMGLFDVEMYMSGMHGGHGGGKTSSFKRCMFLKDIGETRVAAMLMSAIETRPSPLCYLHLLQGGGAVDIAPDATAFGCRNWEFACVVTGTWDRNQDGSEVARAAVQWVYDVARDLMPMCSGCYGADLGPDPRDSVLATIAFGPNLTRLARLKHSFDPYNVLAYACPLPKASRRQRVIILVTGKSAVGKDCCAEVCASDIAAQTGLTTRVVSISDSTKRQYAAATGTNLARLLRDRDYKEQHRPALTTFFEDQVRARRRLPEEHFLDTVINGADVDVLFITGLRDKSPVAALSYLVPDCRLLELRVKADVEMRRDRGGVPDPEDDSADDQNCPSLIFVNETVGDKAVKRFSTAHLLPFFNKRLEELGNMVRSTPNFPRQGIEFRDVLGISQQPGGLVLCTTLLQTHFVGDWRYVDNMVCCETGGFLFASALATLVDVPLGLIREAGKLPPPTISVIKSASYISSRTPSDTKEKKMEMGHDVVARGSSVVVVDDVLASGETLCAVLQLLGEAGVAVEDTGVLVVAEFPVHRGRELLRQRGFGRVRVQSLLICIGE